MSITDRIDQIAKTLPVGVKLIAVSKTKPVEAIEEAYRWGQRRFGESRVQELVEKYNLLPKNIEWHMIGHLQSNKVKYIAPFVSLIHAVDSLSLLEVIDKEAEKSGRVIDCLLQFHIAKEETKFGLNCEEAAELLLNESYVRMSHIRIVGVMGMATYTENVEQIRQEFGHLREMFENLKADYFKDVPAFKELSMGMSGDYRIAVEEGSTMVRIGSSIFDVRGG